jgi:hypothetical protein
MGLVVEEIVSLLQSDEISDSLRLVLYVVFVVLISAVAAYVFFGLYFLVVDYHVCLRDGFASPLWLYCLLVLVLFIASVVTGVYHSLTTTTESIDELEKDENKKGTMWKLLCVITGQSALLLYGYIVMFSGNITCENLKHTGLWTWAEITFHKQVILALYALFVFLYIFSGTPTKLVGDADASLDKTKPSNEDNSQKSFGESDPLLRPIPSNTSEI